MSSLSEEILQQRKTGIGGSDISSIIGLNPYSTAYEIYEDKVNNIRKDLSRNNAVQWGIKLEPIVADMYAEQEGVELEKPEEIYRHKIYSFMLANPDRLIKGKKKGLEIKTTNFKNKDKWGESGSGVYGIPRHYALQCYHYMCVLDYDEWDLAVLIGNDDYRVYTIERDKKIEEHIIMMARTFWKEHVEKKIPPSIDFYKHSVQELIHKKFNIVNEDIVSLEDGFIKKVDFKLDLMAKAKTLKDEIDAVDTEIKNAIGNAGKAILTDGRYFTRKIISQKGYEVKPKNYVKMELVG